MTWDALGATGLSSVLPEVRYRPSPARLFQFSAATGNAHRIHYDAEYARSEGHAGVVVHSTLRGQQLLNVVLQWLGDRGAVTEFSWRNERPAYAERRAVCRGRVLTVVVRDGATSVTIELEERDEDGERAAVGTATVRVPRRPERATAGWATGG
jgi:acyl dehydratase